MTATRWRRSTRALRSAALTIPLRERTKANAATVINEVRMAVRELGRRGVAAGRLDEPEDVMMLLAGELDGYAADPAAFTGVIRERLEGYRALFDLEPPFIIADELPPLSAWARRSRQGPPPVSAGEVLHGVGGSAGTYTGRARVVRDLPAALALEPGEVLVAPLTDAAWTPLFLVAGRGRGRHGRAEQPRRRRVARARHPVRAVRHRRDDAAARRRGGDRRRCRGHGHGGLRARSGVTGDERLDVLDTLYRFAEGIDGCDWALYRSVFTADVDVDYTSYRPGSAARMPAQEWVARAARMFPGLSATQHTLHNPQVRVDGEGARVGTSMRAEHVLLPADRPAASPADDAEVFTIGGRYDHRLTRSSGGWLVAAVTLTVRWQQGDPAMLARAASRVAAGDPVRPRPAG